MRTIFVLDEKNYTDDMPCEERHVVRALIERDGKLAMQKSAAGIYKIPGGTMDPEEDRADALSREVLEETGLVIVRSTSTEIGATVEKRRDLFDPGKIFLRRTYFYSCRVTGEQFQLHLTDSERDLGFTAVWADPLDAIAANEKADVDRHCYERDTRFLEWYVRNREPVAMQGSI